MTRTRTSPSPRRPAPAAAAPTPRRAGVLPNVLPSSRWLDPPGAGAQPAARAHDAEAPGQPTIEAHPRELRDLLDVVAGHVGVLAEQVASVAAAADRAPGTEPRIIALERGLEQLLGSVDTVAQGVGSVERDLLTFDRRQTMTEAALERLYNMCDTLAGGVASLSQLFNLCDTLAGGIQTLSEAVHAVPPRAAAAVTASGTAKAVVARLHAVPHARRAARSDAAAILETVSRAERLVLGYLVRRDRTPEEIAAAIGRKVGTVKQHSRFLYFKFEVASREALIERCAELGILDDLLAGAATPFERAA